MSNRLTPLYLRDFTGGLNMRADAFQLRPNESPDMLNVEVDPRGGFYLRKGWDSWNRSVVTDYGPLLDEDGNPITDELGETIYVNYDAVWSPQHLGVLRVGDEIHFVLANNNNLYHGYMDPLTFVNKVEPFLDGNNQVQCAAPVHGADFAQWGDVLHIVRGSMSSLKFDGSTLSALTPNGPGEWQNDYINPVGGHMPKASTVATHVGYMFVANTVEGEASHPCRVRWSHPNDPFDWAESDYIDILDGGSRIVAIASFSDHLVIFKDDSVWGLFGYNADNWQIVPISTAVGAISKSAVAQSPNSLFFLAIPDGVMAYNQAGIRSISTQLKPLFESSLLNASRRSDFHAGWVNNRLWVGLPISFDGSEVYVFDPTLAEIGSWVRHRCADGGGLGPFTSVPEADGGGLFIGVSSKSRHMMMVDVDGLNSDRIGSTETPFESWYCTAWLNADSPTLKKSWRRPDFVMKDRLGVNIITVNAYRDYDESSIRRQFQIVLSGQQRESWGDPSDIWGEYGDVWGGSGVGSIVVRGKSIGAARAVLLKIQATPGVDWGVDAITMKFIPRRFR